SDGTARSGAKETGSFTSGWTGSVDVDDGAQAVGVSWTDAPTGEVQVRGLTADGWTDWMHVHGDLDDGPDEPGDVTGDLLWFGGDGVSDVEIEVETDGLRNLKVEAMRYEQPEERSSLQVALVPAAGAADTKPSILPRSEWTSK